MDSDQFANPSNSTSADSGIAEHATELSPLAPELFTLVSGGDGIVCW